MEKKSNVTLEYVKNLKEFTPSFLCNFEDNKYDIIFKEICIKDINNKEVLKVKNNNFVSTKDIPTDEIKKIKELEQHSIENSLRMMKYHLNLSKLPNQLKLQYQFMIGQEEVKDFYFLEKYYCNNQLKEEKDIDLKSCSANSLNKIEFFIDIDKFKNLLKNDPNIKGETFIFVEKKLVIHNKFCIHFSE